MMKKTTYLFFLLSVLSNAQENSASRKGEIQFDAGFEYRITPIYRTYAVRLSSFSPHSSVDESRQNSGMGVNLGMEYFLGNNLSLGFSNTFRYDFIVSGQDNIESDFGVGANTYGLLIDYHLSLKYYFKLFGAGDFFISGGFSRLNTNSDFSSKQSFFDDGGNLIGSILSIENSSFFANRFELGYANGKGIIGLGIFMSQTTNYFDDTTSFIVPFVKLGIKVNYRCKR